jgi:hypothetical protein
MECSNFTLNLKCFIYFEFFLHEVMRLCRENHQHLFGVKFSNYKFLIINKICNGYIFSSKQISYIRKTISKQFYLFISFFTIISLVLKN